MATGTYKQTNNPVATYGEKGASVLALQKQLNTQNAGKEGWVPLKEDAMYGPLTQAGVNWKPTTTNVNSTNLNSVINQGNSIDYSYDVPETRKSAKTYDEIYESITNSLTRGLPDRPEPIDYAEQFLDLKSKYGIDELETSLTDLQAQARDIQAIKAQRINAEKGKAVPMNVISGRVSETEMQENERLTAINNSIQTVTSQLQTKYNVVENLMKFTGQTYDDSVQAYNDKFTQNMNMLNLAKGITDDQKSEEESLTDNARANLQIIYNNITAGGADISSLDPVTKANITKLEVQAGLPSGFYTTLVQKNPKADILSTTTRESNGTKYADVIMKNEDGSFSTKSIVLGTSTGGSDNMSLGDKKINGFNEINVIIDQKKLTSNGEPVVDQNDYLTPAGFKQIIKYGATVGITRDDILSTYSDKIYVDPSTSSPASEYGITLKEEQKYFY